MARASGRTKSHRRRPRPTPVTRGTKGLAVLCGLALFSAAVASPNANPASVGAPGVSPSAWFRPINALAMPFGWAAAALPAESTARYAPGTRPSGHSVGGRALTAGANSVDVGVGSGSGTGGAVASGDIPAVALAAYRNAEAQFRISDPTCRLSWSLLAAIGRIESSHGQFAAARLGDSGVSTPPIIGIPLDGRPGIALIRDSDDGAVDGDTVYDRAVGPMQFLPGTWRLVATDGDGDGVSDVHDIHDAASGAARYLCSGSDNLATEQGRSNAVLRYNHSTSYVATVLALANAYERGVSVGPLPASTGAPEPPSAPLDEPASLSDNDPSDLAQTRIPAPSPSATITPSGTATPREAPDGAATAAPRQTPKPSASSTPDRPAPSTTPAPNRTPTPSTTPTTPGTTPTATPDGSPTPSSTPTPSPTATSDDCAAPAPSASPSPTTSPTPSATPSAAPSGTPAPTPTVTASPTASPTPLPPGTDRATVTPSPEPTATTSPTPTLTQTADTRGMAAATSTPEAGKRNC